MAAAASDWREGRSLEWITDTPFEDRPRESPGFMLQGAECYFRFVRKYEALYDTDRYHLYLEERKKPLKKFGNFRVTTFVGFKKGRQTRVFEVFERSNISFAGQFSWSTHQSAVESEMEPDITYRYVWRFVFIFEEPGSQISRTDKSVQTTSDLHPDPCLESLSDDFFKLLDVGSDHDVELKCGDHTFKAHRNVLGTRSEVFGTMLRSDMAEGRTGLVELQDMNSALFQDFIKYLYTGTMPELTADRAKAFYEAGDKYCVTGLMRRCARFLIEDLTLENACEYLVLAHAHSDQDFKNSIISYILDQKMPLNDSRWLAFCDCHSKLGNEVFFRAFK